MNVEVFQEQFENIGFKTHDIIHRETPSKILPSTRDAETEQFIKATSENSIRNYAKPKHIQTTFYQLAKRLKEIIAGLSVSETDKWCSFHQKGGRRFAYILLAKQKPKIEIWCLGNVDYIIQKYATKIKFKTRQKTTGGFGKDFQVNFVVENLEDIENAVLLLSEISSSWSRDELISAFNLYCKIPISEISSKNKKVIAFADLLGKTPKEVAKRFLNFSKLDATVNIIEGMEEEDKSTWMHFNENWEKLAYESENKIIDLENKVNNITEFPKGKERESIVRARINQTFLEMLF